MQPDLTPVFGRFAGREVLIFENKRRVDIGDRDITITEPTLSPGDATVRELKEEVARQGLELRLWLENMVGTMEINPKRLNVYVRKGDDGKYRIGDDISLEGGAPLADGFAAIVARGVDTPVPVMKPLQIKLPGGGA